MQLQVYVWHEILLFCRMILHDEVEEFLCGDFRGKCRDTM